jgi:hypothetical protein
VAGTVELTVTGGSYPRLVGRARPGSGPVFVELGRVTRIEVGGQKGARQPDSRTVTPSDAVGADVQVQTDTGSVALHVVALDGAALRGRVIECRGPGDIPCTGVVEVNLADFDRVELRRVDTAKTVAANLVVGLAVTALVGFLVWMHSLATCDYC